MDAHVLIIGAGIGGLFSACEIEKQIKKEKVMQNMIFRIFEADEEVGGKLYTHNSHDLGAGRFCPGKHSNLEKLVLSLSIPTEPVEYDVIYSRDNNLWEFQKKCIDKLQMHCSLHSNSIQGDTTFFEVCKNCLGENAALEFCRYSGYDTLLNEELSFQKGTEILFNHPESEWAQKKNQNIWLRPVNGFQTLGLQLKKNLQKNWQFHFGHQFHKIEFTGNQFLLTFQNTKKEKVLATSKVVIIALPLGGLRDLDIPWLKPWNFQENIVEVPLFKCYLKYQNLWWKEYQLEGKCLVTNQNLRKIYFSKSENKLFFYTDGPSSLFWKEYIDNGESTILKMISKQLADTLALDVNKIPAPNDFQYRFWKRGVSFWKKESIYSKQIPNAIEIHPNLFICSDLFTHYDGWIEGSLLSGTSIAQKLNLTSLR